MIDLRKFLSRVTDLTERRYYCIKCINGTESRFDDYNKFVHVCDQLVNARISFATWCEETRVTDCEIYEVSKGKILIDIL